MLKKPEVGQVVVTGKKDCCGSGFEEGTIGMIKAITSSPSCGFSIIVKNKDHYWYHCHKCLRRPKKGETL